jgi:hypothetical protein
MNATTNEVGTVRPEDAEREFLEFVDFYTNLAQSSPDEYHTIGYRMDTWQIWAKCIGHEPGDVQFQCRNPGLHVEIDAPNEQPFVCRLGPYTLFREKNLDDCFQRTTTEATFHTQMAMGHMHVYGQPHHFHCELCKGPPDDAQNPPPFDGGLDG